MYKVFIDHKPILFVNESEMLPNLISVTFEKIKDFSMDISIYLEKVTIDKPLQVICSNVHKDFDAVFHDHTLIEAAGGVIRRNDELLMIFRNGFWDIPKGKVDQGESIQDAAIREVEEECGILEPKIASFLCETFHTYLYQGQKALKKTSWFVMDYSGSGDLIPQIEEGITEVKWSSIEEFLKVRGNTYGSINEVIDQYNLTFLKR